mmetsp:Transcript_13589/g.22387  ORF Transcript_13589/g.22387 Transcript_13589/m.22387 type:complete len:302 (-) Transcript_13589:1489-2394(-)
MDRTVNMVSTISTSLLLVIHLCIFSDSSSASDLMVNLSANLFFLLLFTKQQHSTRRKPLPTTRAFCRRVSFCNSASIRSSSSCCFFFRASSSARRLSLACFLCHLLSSGAAWSWDCTTSVEFLRVALRLRLLADFLGYLGFFLPSPGGSSTGSCAVGWAKGTTREARRLCLRALATRFILAAKSSSAGGRSPTTSPPSFSPSPLSPGSSSKMSKNSLAGAVFLAASFLPKQQRKSSAPFPLLPCCAPWRPLLRVGNRSWDCDCRPCCSPPSPGSLSSSSPSSLSLRPFLSSSFSSSSSSFG